MYIHVGNNLVILQSEIIAILDRKAVDDDFYENAFFSKFPLEDLSIKSMWKSVIITNNQLYLSPLSTTTIKKRIQVFR